MPPKKGDAKKGGGDENKKNEKDTKSKPKKDPSPEGKKSSPEKGKKNSPERGKKGSPKKGKGAEQQEVKEEPIGKIKKALQTDFAPFIFEEFRCRTCLVTYQSLRRFMNHTCWQKYYASKFHLGDTQACYCRKCRELYATDAEYSTHECLPDSKPRELEDIQPITYWDHLEFYLYWNDRVKRESKSPYETDWRFYCHCIKCGNRFRNKFHYILHSCFVLSLLEPKLVKDLCMCRECKFVFLNEEQFNSHLKYCVPDKAFATDFTTNVFERSCHQFVIGRHCYEEEIWHVNDVYYDFESSQGKHLSKTWGEISSVVCHECGLPQPSVMEYLYHPCHAGKMHPPYYLEVTLICLTCQCLFMSTEAFQEHTRSCTSSNPVFYRFNKEEIRVALVRWCRELQRNPFIRPRTPPNLMCDICKEIFGTLMALFQHPCPRLKHHTRIFIQPSYLQELFACMDCHTFLRHSSAAADHRLQCPLTKTPTMVQVHPTLEECLVALEPWCKMPHLLVLDSSLGIESVETIEVLPEMLRPP